MQCLEPSKEMQRAFGKIFKELRAIRKEITDLKMEVQERRIGSEAIIGNLHYSVAGSYLCNENDDGCPFAIHQRYGYDTG